MEITLGYSEYDEAWFTESTDSMASYCESLQNDVELALNSLIPYFSEISEIKTYRDLLLVNKEVLTLLEAFELARVELGDEYVEGILARTSGHHKDYLDIYQNALAWLRSPRTDYLCLTNGRFSLAPFEILMIYYNGQDF